MSMIEESNAQYHANTGAISKSALDLFAKSPFHYFSRYIDPAYVEEPPTPAMTLGTAVHCAVLEPDAFPERYMAVPDDAPNRPTEAMRNAKKPSPESVQRVMWWDAFEREAAGRIILPRDGYQRCIAMRDAAARHPLVQQLVRDGIRERSLYADDPEYGCQVKCRPDYLSGYNVDLKTAADASPDAFRRSMYVYRYWVQSPWYTRVTKLALGEAPPMVFLVIESEAPHAIGAYVIAQEDFDLGERVMLRNLEGILEARRTGYFPDFGTGIQTLELTPWQRDAEGRRVARGWE